MKQRNTDLFTKKIGRILITSILIVSTAGIFYFGYKAISENTGTNKENPFEYKLDEFKKYDASWNHYEELSPIPLSFRKVYGIAIGPKDEIHVAGDWSVSVFNNKKLELSFSLDQNASCLSIDKNNDIYIGFDNHIEIFDSQGQKKDHWDPIEKNTIITSIALTTDHVFVADAGNLTIWKLDKKGNKIQRIGDRDDTKDIPGFIIPSPFFDVAVDLDGFLWAANTGRHSLENFTQDGHFRTSWGISSMDMEGFCGCCNPSHFALLENGSFVTSEKGISRIKIYNRLGNLESVVAGPDQFKEGTVWLDLAVNSTQNIYVLDQENHSVRIFQKKTKSEREKNDYPIQ